MHTHSKVALLAVALLAVSSNFALSADKKVAFVPQIIGIPYFDAMKAGGEEAAANSVSISSIRVRSTPTLSTRCRSSRI